MDGSGNPWREQTATEVAPRAFMISRSDELAALMSSHFPGAAPIASSAESRARSPRRAMNAMFWIRRTP